MILDRYVLLNAALAVLLTAASPAMAQDPGNGPWAEIETTSVMVGLGGQSGDGRLGLRNLGTNCDYPFKVSGFGAGIQVNLSRVGASGPVGNLTRLEDFSGQYTATQGEATVLAGGGGIRMKNSANNVTIDLTSRTEGFGLGFSGQGMTVDMPVAPMNAPRVYVLEFGFNKDWLNRESRAKLDQVIGAWKCRFGTIQVVGHTDSVGKEDTNLDLSVRRAVAVRDYLLGAGIFPTRIEPIATGERDLPVETGQAVRLRANRAVVVTVR